MPNSVKRTESRVKGNGDIRAEVDALRADIAMLVALQTGKAADKTAAIVAPEAAPEAEATRIAKIEKRVSRSAPEVAPQQAEHKGDRRFRADMSKGKVKAQIKDRKTGTYREEEKTVYMRQESRDMLFESAQQEMPYLRLAVLDDNGDPTDSVLRLPLGRSAWGEASGEDNIGNVQYGETDVSVAVKIGGHTYELTAASVYFLAQKCLG